MADEPDNFDHKEMYRLFRASGAEMTPRELEAELLDNGDLEGHYTADERNVALFDGLYFSEEQQEWLARFVPTQPERTKLPHSDRNYIHTLNLARLLHDCDIKPSQSFKALAAFDARIDRETAKLNFD